MILGIGTAALGRPQYINVRQEDSCLSSEEFKQQSLSVLEQAYQLGIRYFDTAPGYGLAEQLLLDWIQSKNDDSITIATKWGYTYVANFDPNATVHEIKEHSLENLNTQWEVSKAFGKALKVYQIHSATLDTGVLENRAVLERLQELKIKYNLQIGLTSTGANQVEVLQKAAAIMVGGKPLFDAFQVTYNILDQSVHQIASQLLQDGKRIIIKETLANGRLFRNARYPHYTPVYTVLERLATKYTVGVDAIALQFCVQTLPNSIVLSGAASVSHLISNLKVESFVLTIEEIEELVTLRYHETNYWSERKQLAWN